MTGDKGFEPSPLAGLEQVTCPPAMPYTAFAAASRDITADHLGE